MLAYQLVAPRTLRAVDIPDPTARDLATGQVLVRIEAGGLCGSDLTTFRGLPPARGRWTASSPPAPGPGQPLHEIVGVVVASRDRDLDPGQRVVGWASRSNALAELVVTEGAGLAVVPSNLSPREAIVVQPLACVLSAIARLHHRSPQRAAVLGMGPMGLLFSRVLHDRGTHVTGIDLVDRAGFCADFGVDRFVHTSAEAWAWSLDAADGPDVVVEAVGHQTGSLDAAVRAVRSGGELLCFGIPDEDHYAFPMNTFVRKNLRLVSGVTVERRQALEDALVYLARHPNLVTTFVTHVLPMSAAQEAFEAATRPSVGQAKIVLTWTAE